LIGQTKIILIDEEKLPPEEKLN